MYVAHATRRTYMKDLDSLCQSRLFSGISQNVIPQMLKCLSAAQKEYAKDEMVVREGDLVDDVGIILRGERAKYKIEHHGEKNYCISPLSGWIYRSFNSG